jgi:hypothetical protein
MGLLNATVRSPAALAQRALALLSVLLLFTLGTARCCAAEDNLLPNGDLAEGTGAAPAAWIHFSPFDRFNSDITVFSWKRAPGTPGELTITNLQPDFARWSQTLNLTPGWYLLSAELRIEDAGPDFDARLGVDQGKTTAGVSPDLHRPAQWIPSAFYFKVGAAYRQVRIDCLLNSPGTVSFRNLRLVRSEGARDPATTQYDLDLTWLHEVDWKRARAGRPAGRRRHPRKRTPHSRRPSTGSFWPVLAFIASMAAVAIFGWVGLGGDPN